PIEEVLAILLRQLRALVAAAPSEQCSEEQQPRREQRDRAHPPHRTDCSSWSRSRSRSGGSRTPVGAAVLAVTCEPPERTIGDLASRPERLTTAKTTTTTSAAASAPMTSTRRESRTERAGRGAFARVRGGG